MRDSLTNLMPHASRNSGATGSSDGTLTPILVDGMPRSGTTYLMQLISNHPNVVADQNYPLETRYAVWVLHSLRILSQPQMDKSCEHQWTFLNNKETAEPNPFYLESGPVKKYVNRGKNSIFDEHAKHIVDDFYRFVAHTQNKKDARFFAEKFPGDAKSIFFDVYSNAREVFIVRDPRDVFVSSYNFNQKKGRNDFGAAVCDSDKEFLKHIVNVSYTKYKAALRSKQSCVVSYEEMTRAPREVMKKVCQYCDFPFDDQCLDDIVTATENKNQVSYHGTSDKSSIGRFFDEVSDDMIEFCHKNFSDKIKDMGFSV